MGRRSNRVRQEKKPLYTGDTEAKLTICVKKLRRHLSTDITPQLVSAKAFVTEENVEGIRVFYACRHCQQDPVMHGGERTLDL